MQPHLYHLHALSALHCGTGQSVGIVDLPIARARATQLPIVPGSSLRGVLRAMIEGENPAVGAALFGPRAISGPEDIFAGALTLGDATLLLLPVRALAGILCYVTSPFVLNRYAQDLRRAGLTVPALPAKPQAGRARVAPGSVNRANGTLILEDLDLNAEEDPALGAWASLIADQVHPTDAGSRADLSQRLALVGDDLLAYLSETATEVRTRIAIDPDSGTVKRGALWYEENLPAEAVLWGIYTLEASRNRQDPRTRAALSQALPASGALVQLGGKAGIGRGLCRLLRQEVTHD